MYWPIEFVGVKVEQGCFIDGVISERYLAGVLFNRVLYMVGTLFYVERQKIWHQQNINIWDNQQRKQEWMTEN